MKNISDKLCFGLAVVNFVGASILLASGIYASFELSMRRIASDEVRFQAEQTDGNPRGSIIAARR